MNSNNTALEQRLTVICETLDLPKFNGPRKELDFIEFLRSSHLGSERCIYLLYQVFLARIPTTADILNFVYHFEDDTTSELANRFLNAPEFRTGHQSYTYFLVPNVSEPLLDITHTVSYPLNSGIQRVVRSLAAELLSAGKPHGLIEFDRNINNYRLLDDDSQKYIYAWNGGCKTNKHARSADALVATKRGGVRGLVNRGIIRTRKLAGRRLCAIIDACLLRPKASSRNRESRNHDTHPEYALFLWNHDVIFPELNIEPRRIEVVRSMLEHTNVNSSLVIFDMIPLTHPEYFIDSNGYIHFLTLLRCVDRVSCISRAVEQNVRDLMPLIHRGDTMPEITTHYLGGDFGATLPKESLQTAMDTAEASDLPVVLAVGTIEIRKNHRRILHAMIKAQKQGYRFRGVFVGGPGWLNESFPLELGYFQHKGFDVELKGTVTEAILENLYQSAAFTIYGSLAEGFGLPIVESVVRGVPCITSNRGCMREVAEQIGGCVLVDPESEDSIANAITSLLDDPNALKELRTQAENATWRKWSDYAEDIYQFATQPKVKSKFKAVA